MATEFGPSVTPQYHGHIRPSRVLGNPGERRGAPLLLLGRTAALADWSIVGSRGIVADGHGANPSLLIPTTQRTGVDETDEPDAKHLVTGLRDTEKHQPDGPQ